MPNVINQIIYKRIEIETTQNNMTHAIERHFNFECQTSHFEVKVDSQ